MEKKDRLRFIRDLFEFNNENPALDPYYESSATNLSEVGLLREKNEPREQIVDVLAFCLMPNHYHALFTPTISEELSACIAHFSSIYAKYFNKKYEIDGHLWQRRYWSGHVGEGGHLARVWRYIEQNPVRAGMVLTPDQWEWSSAAFRSTGHRPHYLMEPDWWGTAVMKQWWKNEMLTSSELAEIRNSYIVPGTTVSPRDTLVPGTIQCPNGTSTDRRDIGRSTTRESGRFD